MVAVPDFLRGRDTCPHMTRYRSTPVVRIGDANLLLSSTNLPPLLPIKLLLKLPLMLLWLIRSISTATSSASCQSPSLPSPPSCLPIPWTACTKSSSLRATSPASQPSPSRSTPTWTSAAPRTTSAPSTPSAPTAPFYTTANALTGTLTSPTRWTSMVSTTFPMTLSSFPRQSANSDSFVSLSAETLESQQ